MARLAQFDQAWTAPIPALELMDRSMAKPADEDTVVWLNTRAKAGELTEEQKVEAYHAYVFGMTGKFADMSAWCDALTAMSQDEEAHLNPTSVLLIAEQIHQMVQTIHVDWALLLKGHPSCPVKE